MVKYLEETFYNDAANWPVYLVGFLSFMLVLYAAILFHELGHILYFRLKKDKRIRLRFIVTNKYLLPFLAGWKIHAGELSDYEFLSRKEYTQANLYGILLGAAPILVGSVFFFGPALLLLIPYLYGCRQDLQEVFKNIDWEKEEVES